MTGKLSLVVTERGVTCPIIAVAGYVFAMRATLVVRFLEEGVYIWFHALKARSFVQFLVCLALFLYYGHLNFAKPVAVVLNCS